MKSFLETIIMVPLVWIIWALLYVIVAPPLFIRDLIRGRTKIRYLFCRHKGMWTITWVSGENVNAGWEAMCNPYGVTAECPKCGKPAFWTTLEPPIVGDKVRNCFTN